MSTKIENQAPFLRSMNREERIHCLLDLDRVTEGQMTAVDFMAKYAPALRVLLDPAR